MTTTLKPSPSNSKAPQGGLFEMKVSAYDRVSSLLVALLILVGVVVGLLLLLWLTSVIRFRPRVPAVEPLLNIEGQGAGVQGIAQDLEEPGVEELPDTEPQLAEMLSAVPDIVSSQTSALLALEGNASEAGSGSGLGSRLPGDGTFGNTNAVPEWQRLEARLSSKNLNAYIAQLDYFGIELGSLDRDSPRIDFARNFAKAKPDTRSSTRDEENRAGRLYFIHEQGGLMAWDRLLLERGGVKTKGRILAQFFPSELRQDLLAKEQARLGGRSLADVKKTVFAVRVSGSTMAFEVIEQTYR